MVENKGSEMLRKRFGLVRLSICFSMVYGVSILLLLLNNDSFGRNKAKLSSKKVILDNFLPKKSEYPPILTAYLEEVDIKDWKKKPLPIRQTANASNLRKILYPALYSCSKLPSQWPVDFYPEGDPFLPWIHDVFPSHDGSTIHFIAQNKRRCHTGTAFKDLKRHLQPQAALFQNIAVKKFTDSNSTMRYKLSSYEEADPDGVETRFICRFKPSMIETLSTYPFNYDYATFRKRYSSSFTEGGFDNHMLWSSQLLFDCPVPTELQELIKSGETVIDDYATLFLDLIPIRTPPRYGKPGDFLPPKYEVENSFNAKKEYGDHILPLIEDSGRWENIPICESSQKTYEENNPEHSLVACTWAANSYQTRKSHVVPDGSRRLHEWITFHLLAGFDHMYIYDNSGAVSGSNSSLKSVTDSFPSSKVTRVDWPSRVCNNKPNNVDDKGERSSQYAAEASCRKRFGPHTKWMSTLDADEYLVPMGDYYNLKDLLLKLEKEKKNVISFKSLRSRPLYKILEPPIWENCTSPYDKYKKCFQPIIRKSSSFLETYNCEKELPPKKNWVPAEKQIMYFTTLSTILPLPLLRK